MDKLCFILNNAQIMLFNLKKKKKRNHAFELEYFHVVKKKSFQFTDFVVVIARVLFPDQVSCLKSNISYYLNYFSLPSRNIFKYHLQLNK